MKLDQIDTDVLLQMYANADVTCSQCGGHFKGEQNDRPRMEYALELKSRGIIVPKSFSQKCDKLFVSTVEIPKGVFNGPGSY